MIWYEQSKICGKHERLYQIDSSHLDLVKQISKFVPRHVGRMSELTDKLFWFKSYLTDVQTLAYGERHDQIPIKINNNFQARKRWIVSSDKFSTYQNLTVADMAPSSSGNKHKTGSELPLQNIQNIDPKQLRVTVRLPTKTNCCI